MQHQQARKGSSPEQHERILEQNFTEHRHLHQPLSQEQRQETK